MNLRLFSLAFAPFAFGTSAFVFIGLLGPMATDFGVGISVIGQLQTVFALACGIGGPILARLLARYDRKPLLLLVMAILTVMNIGSAVAPQFGQIAMIRFAGGFFAALSLPLATTLAVNMVPEIKRPSAIATVLAGYTLAFLIGMPLGSVLGDSFGWRSSFWFAAAISGLALAFIGIGAPTKIIAVEAGDAGFKAALRGKNIILMSLTLLCFTATFCTVSFIGPVITRFSGLDGAAIGAVQVATGVGSLLGLPLGAMLAKLQTQRALAMLFCATVGSQLLFSIGMYFDLGVLALPFLLIAMIAGSGALFATSPIIQTNIAQASGPATTIAFAFNGSMVYFGQGIGASLGGAVAAAVGLAWIVVAGAVMALVALAINFRLGKI